MFNKKCNCKVDELTDEISDLKEKKIKLEDEVRQLKLEHKIAEEDIKHMIAMKEERLDLEHEKKIVALQKDMDKQIMDIKEKYRDKVEKQLEKESGNMKEMYGQILARLPNVTAHFGQKNK